MYELVLKDFTNSKPLFLAWLLWIPLCIGMNYIPGFEESSKLWPFLFCYLSILNLFSGEEAWKPNFLFASLPYTKRSLMKARYISVWIIVIIVFVFFTGLNLFWVSVVQGGMNVKSFQSHITDFIVASVMVLLTIPFISRFGATAGIWLGMLATILFSVLLLIGKEFGLFGVAKDILNSLAHTAQMKNIILALFVFLLLFLGTMVSFRISARLFEGRDLG